MDSRTFQVVKYRTDGSRDEDTLLVFDADSVTVKDGLLVTSGSSETLIVNIGANQTVREKRNCRRHNVKLCPRCGQRY